MTSRKRMEDSERWRAVGRIEGGQSIPDIALFLGVHHSVTSRLWKPFQTTQTVVRRPVGDRPWVTTPAEDRYIAIVAKRSRRVTSHVCHLWLQCPLVRIYLQLLYCTPKSTYEWTVCPDTSSLCSSVRPIKRGARLKWCREHGHWTTSD
ncbi:uncharacterized protein TNCV_4285191 [Trichonephila clavipes]|nr:uncharacterized protein TNCV_4285191 [Trichonephila clavipes]